MKAILFVKEDDESFTILKFLQNKNDLGQKLKKVKINMKIKKPYLQVGKTKIVGIANILKHLQPQPRRPLPPTRRVDYDEEAYKHIYSDNVKTQIPDDDDVDENVKMMKKKQFEEQYSRHKSRIDNPVVPKRVQLDQHVDEYEESPEEKKADELDNYYRRMMESGGD